VRLWRISDFANLNGDGGLFASGRWHARGRRIAYLSDHPASALLELMVHLEVDAEELPSSFQLLTVEADDDIAFDSIELDDLGSRWRTSPAETQAAGGRWLTEGKSALLRVPSAIVPFATNWLLNPMHPDVAKVRIVGSQRIAFDPRLLE
jgi:RES domain-containing protein